METPSQQTILLSLNDLPDHFKKIHDKFVNDIKIDQLNLKDKSIEIIGIKHFWVAQLMQAKCEMNKLLQVKTKAIEIISKRMMDSEGVSLTKATAEKIALKHDKIVEIQQKINEQQLLVEYLDKIEKICHNATYDIKNLIEVIKLETL